MHRPRDRATSDAGFTLVELLVYMVLSILVLGIVTSLVISGIRGQADVEGVVGSTNSAQSVANTIQADVRRSTYIRVATVNGTDVMVTMRVPNSASVSTGRCVAYYWSSSSNEIRFRQATTSIGTPNSTAVTTWATLGTDVEQNGTTAVFAGDGTQDSAYLQLSLKVSAGDYPDATISARTYPRNPDATEAAPCF